MPRCFCSYRVCYFGISCFLKMKDYYSTLSFRFIYKNAIYYYCGKVNDALQHCAGYNWLGMNGDDE